MSFCAAHFKYDQYMNMAFVLTLRSATAPISASQSSLWSPSLLEVRVSSSSCSSSSEAIFEVAASDCLGSKGAI